MITCCIRHWLCALVFAGLLSRCTAKGCNILLSETVAWQPLESIITLIGNDMSICVSVHI